MLTNGKLTQDGVTCLSYRNLNKIIRASLCSGFACYLQGLLSWKIGHNLRQKTAHFKAKTSILTEFHAPSYV